MASSVSLKLKMSSINTSAQCPRVQNMESTCTKKPYPRLSDTDHKFTGVSSSYLKKQKMIALKDGVHFGHQKSDRTAIHLYRVLNNMKSQKILNIFLIARTPTIMILKAVFIFQIMNQGQ